VARCRLAAITDRHPAKSIVVASELLDRLKAWKQVTQFSSNGDWVFASSVKLGRLPFSYRGVAQTIDCAANAAGIRKISTHAFRHSFRSWLGAEGVPVAIQKELMRHSTIGMTLAVRNNLRCSVKDASTRVADLLFANGAQAERKSR
jgi:integrase